jgi:hypothetical protein
MPRASRAFSAAGMQPFPWGVVRQAPGSCRTGHEVAPLALPRGQVCLVIPQFDDKASILPQPQVLDVPAISLDFSSKFRGQVKLSHPGET